MNSLIGLIDLIRKGSEQKMSNNEKPRLCGGIFLALILEARPQRTNYSEHFKGDTDGLSETNVIVNLCKVVKPDYKKPTKQDSFETTVSKYKSCGIRYSNYIPITMKNESRLFNIKVTGNYSIALKSMCEFVNFYIDNGVESGSARRLILNLLELILLDDYIKPEDLLYVCSDGKPIRKSELLDLKNIEIQPFLLGVLHYISHNRINNKIGEITYNNFWINRDDRKEFKGNFGSNFSFNGEIEMYDSRKIIIQTQTTDSNIFNGSTESTESIDAEMVDEYEEPEKEMSASFSKNGITFKVNMVQSGNNNTQVMYAENVYSSSKNFKNGDNLEGSNE